MSGPETLRAWVYEAKNEGLIPMVGGVMTHPAYLKEDGGFIGKSDALRIYELAAESGVTDFVVPGNNPETILKIKETLAKYDVLKPRFYSPGLVVQGGKIKGASDVAGDLDWHAIIGRGIYKSNDIKGSAKKYISELTGNN
jgi:orotidine-5'-phosphate decarboxylase